jgi:gamma-glutamyl-gamma-aminobutyrate hydrolase PuuD
VKPRIGLSGYPRRTEIAIGPVLLHTASRFYVDSVMRAGGLPLVLPVIDVDEVAELLDAVHGVVLTGGGDVEPSRYGADPEPENWGVDPARDDFEEALLRGALERDMPVLATCRGMQVVNVALGGTLVQHVPKLTGQDHSQEPHWREGVHRIKIEADSHLAEALGATELDVNSLHHQAVLEPAPGLRAVAWAEDGTVEAIELDGNRNLVAVQWHPELLEDWPEQQGLFRQLVGRAAELRSEHG